MLLVSQVVDLVLAYRVRLGTADPPRPVSLAGPLQVFLPAHPRHVPSRLRPLSLSFYAIERHQATSVPQRHSKRCLFKLFSVYEDLSIVEHIYRCIEPKPTSMTECNKEPLLLLPTKTSIPGLSGQLLDQNDLGDFLVSEDWTKRMDRTGKGGTRSAKYSPKKQPNEQTRLLHDWQDIYASLIDESVTSTPNSRRNMAHLVGDLGRESGRARSPRIYLTSEILSIGLRVTDIDSDSEHFESSLISIFDSARKHDAKLIRLPVYPTTRSQPAELISIYNALVAIHLTPLSPQVPDRVRVIKERLARNVAADLLLASTAVRAVPGVSSSVISPRTVLEPSSSQPVGSSTPPCQTRIMPSSSGNNSQVNRQEENSVVSRLGIYTSIIPPASFFTASTSPEVSSIIRHLPASPYPDPASYSWQETERTLAAEHEEELAIEAAAQDPRAKRKAEKARLARAKKEEGRSLAIEEVAKARRELKTVVSSQATGRVAGVYGNSRMVQSSQVRGMDWDGVGQSQQSWPGQAQELPMTQPESGAFGTRRGATGVAQNKETMRKRRAAGF